METFSFRVPGDHPALKGHFPDRPVVPGVVILDEVIATIRQRISDRTFIGFINVKFHASLGPDRLVAVQWSRKGSGTVAFSCRSDTMLVVTGVAEFKDAKP